MKSLILYGCDKKLTNSHRLVTGSKQPKYYVRAEVYPGSIEDALMNADNFPEEVVLNTVEIP